MARLLRILSILLIVVLALIWAMPGQNVVMYAVDAGMTVIGAFALVAACKSTGG